MKQFPKKSVKVLNILYVKMFVSESLIEIKVCIFIYVDKPCYTSTKFNENFIVRLP